MLLLGEGEQGGRANLRNAHTFLHLQLLGSVLATLMARRGDHAHFGKEPVLYVPHVCWGRPH